MAKINRVSVNGKTGEELYIAEKAYGKAAIAVLASGIEGENYFF